MLTAVNSWFWSSGWLLCSLGRWFQNFQGVYRLQFQKFKVQHEVWVHLPKDAVLQPTRRQLFDKLDIIRDPKIQGNMGLFIP
jgi:hypothetical protein